MTQRTIVDLFSQSSSSSMRSNKRSRINAVPPSDRDEFDDIFEAKRQRTANPINKSSGDVFEFDVPSTNTVNKNSTGTYSVKREIHDDDDETKTMDDIFTNGTRKKARQQLKQEQSFDLLDMFQTRTHTNNSSHKPSSTMDDVKMSISSNSLTKHSKIKMFFDDSDLKSIREQVKEQSDSKEYAYVKPVVIIGGRWLSKQAETKSTCDIVEQPGSSIIGSHVPDDQRNLMHIEYAPLVVNSKCNTNKKRTEGGKKFHKQIILSDSMVVRKENLQSCYNALLEDLNKPQISSSRKQKQIDTKKPSSTDVTVSDDEDMNNLDFFDLSTRKKKF